MQGRRIRTVIVDDEPLARERLRSLLAKVDGIEIVTECGGGIDALETLARTEVDLLFLDVQMPGLDGFEVLAQLGGTHAPAVIFATAYDEFATRAFEAHAVDYLLKPIGLDRLSSAVERARQALALPRSARTPVPLRPLLEASRVGRKRIAVRNGSRFQILRTDDILWIEAADNYVRLHTATESHLYRAKMKDMEALLDPQKFVRIHRSLITNVEHVTGIEPWGLMEYVLVLTDGTRVTSSRGYRQRLRDAFGL